MTSEDRRASKLERIERGVERRLREMVDTGELNGLPGEGAPLAVDDGGDDPAWAARHVMRNADAVPLWVDVRHEIDERLERLRRRYRAHHEWLRDRTRLLAELRADRIVEASRATAERDARVRRELEHELSEVNALIRRYDLLVIPALQLPLATLDRLGE